MNNFNAVLDKLNEIRQIVENRPVGTYIYRGESEHYEEVCSNFYRFCRDENLPIASLTGIKDLLKQSLRKFTRFTDEEHEAEFEDMIQHYGGLTNRIDFTNDYLIALFFACYGSSNENGRIIILEQDKINFSMERGYCEIRPLQGPNNRVIAQKSVFVIPSEGFIDIKQDGVLEVNIPKNLKRDILKFLRKHHGISVETIYGDFAGVIRLQRVYLKATSYYLQGNSWILDSQYELAISKFDEAIKVDSNYAAAYQARGVAYAYKGEVKPAIRNFSEAIEMSQYNAKSYLSRGNVYAKIGEYDEAIADFKKADQEQIPREDIVLPRIYISLGNAYAKIEEYDEAIKILNHAIRILPDLYDPSGWRPSDDTYDIAGMLHCSLGNIYAKIGEESRAISCFEKAIEWSEYKRPRRSYFHMNLSTVYRKIGESEKAIEHADKTIGSQSNFVDYLRRGNFYFKIGGTEKALDDFNEAIKTLKKYWYDALIYFYRGNFYAEIRNIKGAICSFKGAASLQNYHKWLVAAFYNRYRVYFEIGDIEKATDDFNEAKTLEPKLAEDSPPAFLFPMEMVSRKPDIYLNPILHDWEIDLSLDLEVQEIIR